MSDGDNYYPRHIFYALGLLDSDEEREYENDMDENESSTGNNSQVWEEINNTPCPYLCYALGLGDCPCDSENETSESDESDEMEIEKVLT